MFTFRYAELVLNNEPLSITFTEEDDSSSRDGKTRLLHSPQKRRRGTADTPAGAGDENVCFMTPSGHFVSPSGNLLSGSDLRQIYGEFKDAEEIDEDTDLGKCQSV